MAKIDSKKFVPTPEEQRLGVAPMTQAEIVESLTKYKAQNPLKYEAKKMALFTRYGLTPDAITEPVLDANDIELKEIKKTVANKAIKK